MSSRSIERPLRVTRAIDEAHARMLAVRQALGDMTALRGHVPLDPPGPDGAGPAIPRHPTGHM